MVFSVAGISTPRERLLSINSPLSNLAPERNEIFLTAVSFPQDKDVPGLKAGKQKGPLAQAEVQKDLEWLYHSQATGTRSGRKQI